MQLRKSSIEPTTKINSMYLCARWIKMNDPEVMERIAEALERIAWLIGIQVGEEWPRWLNLVLNVDNIILVIVITLVVAMINAGATVASYTLASQN